jgi:FkbM family methyltransferase
MLSFLTAPYRFRRHLGRYREVVAHLRWSRADKRRQAFYRQFIRPGALAFDVGANVGNRSKIFRSIGARVVAFEPQSHCADFLEAAFAGDADFTLKRIALSDRAGELTLHLSDEHVLSTLDTEWIERMNGGGRFANRWTRSERVAVVTLDQMIEEHGVPEFVKIDVEGHELNVIRGLNQPVRHVSLEFASEAYDRMCECVDRLAALGRYEFRLSLGESMEFGTEPWEQAAGIKATMQKHIEADRLAWGDIYARLG